MNARTGGTISADHDVVVSPDSLRFATAANHWFNCAEQDHPSLDVWRLTDTLPVREWRLDPFNCRTNAGWGPTNPHWRGPTLWNSLETTQYFEMARRSAPTASSIACDQCWLSGTSTDGASSAADHSLITQRPNVARRDAGPPTTARALVAADQRRPSQCLYARRRRNRATRDIQEHQKSGERPKPVATHTIAWMRVSRVHENAGEE